MTQNTQNTQNINTFDNYEQYTNQLPHSPNNIPQWLQNYNDKSTSFGDQISNMLRLANILRKKMGWFIDIKNDPYARNLDIVENNSIISSHITDLSYNEIHMILLQTISILIGAIQTTDIFINDIDDDKNIQKSIAKSFMKYCKEY